MTTLAALADDVYVLTNRPDLVNETRVALRKAIMKVHGADTFKRDLVIQRLQMSLFPALDPNQHRWTIPLSEFPRFRRPKALHYPLDRNFPILPPAPLIDWGGITTRTREFTEVASDNLFDSYRSEVLNYFFIAGSTLNIKATFGVDYLDLHYYQYPLVPSNTSDQVLSWICDQFPDCVIEEAAGTVFKMIGKDEEHARYQTLFSENLGILRGTDVGEGV